MPECELDLEEKLELKLGRYLELVEEIQMGLSQR